MSLRDFIVSKFNRIRVDESKESVKSAQNLLKEEVNYRRLETRRACLGQSESSVKGDWRDEPVHVAKC